MIPGGIIGYEGWGTNSDIIFGPIWDHFRGDQFYCDRTAHSILVYLQLWLAGYVHAMYKLAACIMYKLIYKQSEGNNINDN